MRKAVVGSWPASGVWALSVCLLSVAPSASCRKEAPTNEELSSPPALETVDPVFLVPGYEDELETDYGLPWQGLVASSVSYKLDERFPAMEFFDAVQRHLHGLGWFVPRFTFDYPPKLASEDAVWRILPTAEPPLLMLEQVWVRDDDVLTVAGQCLPVPGGSIACRSPVHVNILRYHPAEAERTLNEYRDLHGALPSAQADAPMLPKGKPAAKVKEP